MVVDGIQHNLFLQTIIDCLAQRPGAVIGRGMRLLLFQRKEALHECSFHGEHLLANGELNTNVLSSLVDPTDFIVCHFTTFTWK